MTVDGDDLRIMPGALGKFYQSQAGPVRFMGKPAPIVYEAGFRLFGAVAKADIVAIGDSFEHDIAGANTIGIDSVFVACGIHARDVQLSQDGQISMSALEQVCERFGAYPKFWMPSLIV